MKSTLINRIRLAVVSGVLVLAGVVVLAVPSASAVSVDPCLEPAPVAGEDDGVPGLPTVICTPEGADTVSPYVTINNPSTDSFRRNQTVLVTALAMDNVGVVNTEIYVNGTLEASAPGGYAAASWTPTAKGTYTLTAKAYDAAGNVGTSSALTVFVK